MLAELPATCTVDNFLLCMCRDASGGVLLRGVALVMYRARKVEDPKQAFCSRSGRAWVILIIRKVHNKNECVYKSTSLGFVGLRALVHAMLA